MDDASERNIRDLRLLAESMVERYRREITGLCDRLARIAASRASRRTLLGDRLAPNRPN
jgi:hypothetical protein